MSAIGVELSSKSQEITLHGNEKLFGDASSLCELFGDPGQLQIASVNLQTTTRAVETLLVCVALFRVTITLLGDARLTALRA
jgi:hypothetical protein